MKAELQSLANKLGIDINGNHLSPGTSKRNKLEQRIFAFISMNERDKPPAN